MADITVTAAQVAPVDGMKANIRSYVATEAITKGQAVYFLTTGKVGIADANAGGKQQFRGIALQSVGAGQAVEVLHEGPIYGFTVSGNADAFLYLSDTAGALGDGVGTMTVACARIITLTDNDATKVPYIFTQWEAAWA